MASHKRVKVTPRVREAVAAFRASSLNVSETARVMGLARTTVKECLSLANKHGLLDDVELQQPSVPTSDEYLSAKARKVQAYQDKKKKGTWRKPVMTRLTAEPYRLKLFGDPHLDADGCNFELFERHWLEMSTENRVYGICVGDWFNNWLRALGHLWKEETSRPSDAWLCLEYLMEQRGAALIAACSGNHDDWSHGPVDPVDQLMKRYGVLYRKGAIRVEVHHEGAEPMWWSIRHKWRGSSMYSAGHWGVAHRNVKWRDDLMIGGHIHQDDPRLAQQDDGSWSHVCQISAFKEFDEYADVHGLSGTQISPVWDLVIDPRRKRTDVDRVKTFWDSGAAQSYLEAIS